MQSINSNNRLNNYAAVAAISIIWVVLAYLSRYTTGTIAGISFYLPILLIFTVPLLFGRDMALLIGVLGGAFGVNYLISGGFDGALTTLVFTVGVMMLGTYYLAPKSMVEMRKATDWFAYIVLTVVLLAVGETLAGAVGSSPNLVSAWNSATPTLVGGIILAIVNCILLRTVPSAFARSEMHKATEPHVSASQITNQSKQ